jgi:cell division protein FtsQ
MLVGGLAYAIASGAVGRAAADLWRGSVAMTVDAGFAVQAVTVTGRGYAARDDILAATGLSRGAPILLFDVEAARRRIEGLGWVKHASVMRRLPDEVRVDVTERRPFARWQIGGKTALIDRAGVVITHQRLPEFKHLPRVVGEGAAVAAADLFDQLARNPKLFAEVRDATRIRDRRWDIRFTSGVVARLPEKGVAEAWSRLASLQERERVLDKQVTAVDLRLSDRVFVRLTPEAAERRRAPGQET